VLEFFEKLNKWTEMMNASRRLLDHVNRVQSSLAVSTVVFKKFLPIFRRVFTNQAVTPSSGKGKKREGGPVSSQQLFDFIWTAFVAMKKQFPTGGDDLMNSFHLLICLVDLVVEDLQEVADLSQRFLQPDFLRSLAGEHVTLDQLCDQFEGVVLDAKFSRAHWLVPKLRAMAEDTEVLQGWEKPGGLLSNLQAKKDLFDAIYEEGMLRRAEVDERLFVSPQSAAHNMDVVFNEALDCKCVVWLREGNYIGN